MCVNEGPREACRQKIEQLTAERLNEIEKRKDLVRAKGEIQQLLDEAKCAIDNLSNCDFGGTKILDSVTTSQQGYQERMDYYDKYIIECDRALECILFEEKEAIAEMATYPVPCGSCYECCPPEDNTNGVRGSGNTGRTVNQLY